MLLNVFYANKIQSKPISVSLIEGQSLTLDRQAVQGLYGRRHLLCENENTWSF